MEHEIRVSVIELELVAINRDEESVKFEVTDSRGFTYPVVVHSGSALRVELPVTMRVP